ncbi:hypothetical protein GCM10027346_10510 [Hymenobacter seoulensis]
MKQICVLLLLASLLAFRSAATPYYVLPAASRLAWTGYAEVGSYSQTGTVQLRSGTFEYDGRSLRQGRFEFDMRTIQHQDAKLTEHLRAADFFDVEQYPSAVFVLNQVQNGVAAGRLTLHGITKPVQFPLTITRLPDGRLRIIGTATLDRTQYGVNYNSSSFFQNLGSYAIRNEFKLAFEVVAQVKK